jgi:Conserved TM helix/Mechanosensitive ion channel
VTSDSARSLGDTFAQASTTLVERMAAQLPNIAAAVLLLLAGWLLAKALRAIAVRAVLLTDTLLLRIGLRAGLPRERVARSAVVVGALVFWTVLLLFVTAATQVLGLEAFAQWLVRLLDYVPTLAAGLLILAVGWLLSGFAADLAETTATRLEPRQRLMLARIVRITILAGAILIGADQIGIRITFLAIFAAAVVFTVGGGVAIAVGFGAREHVANLIAAHHWRGAFAPGQTLRVGEHEGRLLEVTATGVVLESAEGRIALPARLLNELPVTVVSRAHG